MHSALDGTFERKPFGAILQLIPLSESVVKLSGIDMLFVTLTFYWQPCAWCAAARMPRSPNGNPLSLPLHCHCNSINACLNAGLARRPRSRLLAALIRSAFILCRARSLRGCCVFLQYVSVCRECFSSPPQVSRKRKDLNSRRVVALPPALEGKLDAETEADHEHEPEKARTGKENESDCQPAAKRRKAEEHNSRVPLAVTQPTADADAN